MTINKYKIVLIILFQKLALCLAVLFFSTSECGVHHNDIDAFCARNTTLPSPVPVYPWNIVCPNDLSYAFCITAITAFALCLFSIIVANTTTSTVTVTWQQAIWDNIPHATQFVHNAVLTAYLALAAFQARMCLPFALLRVPAWTFIGLTFALDVLGSFGCCFLTSARDQVC